MKPPFFSFNPSGVICRCRCFDNHPGQAVCEWSMDEGVCSACARLLVADLKTVIRDLVGVLQGTPTNAKELKARL